MNYDAFPAEWLENSTVCEHLRPEQNMRAVEGERERAAPVADTEDARVKTVASFVSVLLGPSSLPLQSTPLYAEYFLYQVFSF